MADSAVVEWDVIAIGCLATTILEHHPESDLVVPSVGWVWTLASLG